MNDAVVEHSYLKDRCSAGRLEHLAIVDKGSIAVNGISLTVIKPQKGCFSAAILPYTETETSLRTKKKGDIVNIETDILAKIIAKQMGQSRLQPEFAGDLYQKKEFDFNELISE